MSNVYRIQGRRDGAACVPRKLRTTKRGARRMRPPAGSLDRSRASLSGPAPRTPLRDDWSSKPNRRCQRNGQVPLDSASPSACAQSGRQPAGGGTTAFLLTRRLEDDRLGERSSRRSGLGGSKWRNRFLPPAYGRSPTARRISLVAGRVRVAALNHGVQVSPRGANHVDGRGQTRNSPAVLAACPTGSGRHRRPRRSGR